MKHNLETLRKILNNYLKPDPITGLIPMTPIHVEINNIRDELQHRLDAAKEFENDNTQPGTLRLGSIGFQHAIEEFLGKTK